MSVILADQLDLPGDGLSDHVRKGDATEVFEGYVHSIPDLSDHGADKPAHSAFTEECFLQVLPLDRNVELVRRPGYKQFLIDLRQIDFVVVDGRAGGEAIGLISLRVRHMDSNFLNNGTPLEIVHHHVREFVLILAIADDSPADPLDKHVQECFRVCGAAENGRSQADQAGRILDAERLSAESLRIHGVYKGVNLRCVHMCSPFLEHFRENFLC